MDRISNFWEWKNPVTAKKTVLVFQPISGPSQSRSFGDNVPIHEWELGAADSSHEEFTEVKAFWDSHYPGDTFELFDPQSEEIRIFEFDSDFSLHYNDADSYSWSVRIREVFPYEVIIPLAPDVPELSLALGSVLITTTPTPRATGYRVERSPTGENDWSLVGGSEVSVTTGEALALEDNPEDGIWDYRGRAFNAYGVSDWTGVQTIEVTGPFEANDYSGLLKWRNPLAIALSDAVAVASFPDSSPANDPSVQADAAKQPIFYLTGGQNNKRRVVFDGANDFLEDTRLTALRELYILVKHATGTSANGPVMIGDDSTYPFLGESGTALFASGPGGAQALYGDSQFYVNGRLANYTLEKKSTDWTLYSIVTSIAAAEKYLFNDRNAYFYNGEFGEDIHYSDVHGKTDRHAINAHFADPDGWAMDLAVQSQPPANTKFLFSGNSILQEGTIVMLLMQAMNPASSPPFNWAAAGATTQDMATNASGSEDAGFDGSKDFNVLVGWEISNDLANTDLGSTDTTTAANAAYTAIANYYAARKAAHPTEKIVVIPCLPRNSNLHASMTGADFEFMMNIVNAGLVDNWATFGDVLADFSAFAAIYLASLSADGTHPNDGGKKEIARALISAVGALNLGI